MKQWILNQHKINKEARKYDIFSNSESEHYCYVEIVLQMIT